MWYHETLTQPEFKRLVRGKKILFAGNKNLKVYGTLHCGSGKRMKISNRVFFESEKEAIALGYRPCRNCLRRTSLLSASN
jgi:methylphosphotriester-DNA--protein-cysteine methyltransferase